MENVDNVDWKRYESLLQIMRSGKLTDKQRAEYKTYLPHVAIRDSPRQLQLDSDGYRPQSGSLDDSVKGV